MKKFIAYILSYITMGWFIGILYFCIEYGSKGVPSWYLISGSIVMILTVIQIIRVLNKMNNS